VETPRLNRLPEARRRAILRTLQLAQELGAETATLSDPDEARAVLRYAREHNLGKIVTGRQPQRRWRRDSFAQRLGQLGPDLDLLVVALDEPVRDAPHPLTGQRVSSEKWRLHLRGCLMAIALCMLVTIVGRWLLVEFDPANGVMIYLLAVVLVALRYGRWPSVFATVINILAFDLFFVAPTGTVAVSDLQYLVTFAVMLAVGVIVGNLTAGVRYQAKVARYREQRARHLYEMAKSLGSALTPQDIAATSQRVIDVTLQARSQLLLPDEQGELQAVGDSTVGTPPDLGIAKWSYSKAQPAGAGTDTLPAVPYQILPLKSGNHCRGLLVVEPENLRQLMIPEQQRLVETFTVLIANALERMALSQSEAASRLAAEREQLRNALLSALSHDLRTPLTVLFGQAEMLMLDLAGDNSKYVGQANQIREQTLSTIRLVSNMLDMARIQSGGLNLREEWVALDEVVGGALSSMGPSLKGHDFVLDLPPELVLIKGDSAMLERVFTNLIENSLKYAGNAAQHGIRAWRDKERLEIAVWDNGPGIAEENMTRIFDKFSRGDKESAVPGVGLGLAISKTIIESHRGRIWAENRPQGGAEFRLSLPLPAAPEISEEALK